MRKHALLLGSARTRGESLLPGVVTDLSNYNSFLMDAIGGAWVGRGEEITVKSDFSSIDRAMYFGSSMDRMKLDYLFLVFCGHGFYDSTQRKNFIMGEDGVPMAVEDLQIPAKKSLLIIDACRRVIPTRMLATASRMDASDTVLTHSNAKIARQIFENAIEQSEKGRSVVYSTRLGAAADEDENGGRFTYELLTGAREWYRVTPAGRVLDIAEAVATASGRLRNGQNPEAYFGRRHYMFPFAVS